MSLVPCAQGCATWKTNRSVENRAFPDHETSKNVCNMFCFVNSYRKNHRRQLTFRGSFVQVLTRGPFQTKLWYCNVYLLIFSKRNNILCEDAKHFRGSGWSVSQLWLLSTLRSSLTSIWITINNLFFLSQLTTICNHHWEINETSFVRENIDRIHEWLVGETFNDTYLGHGYDLSHCQLVQSFLQHLVQKLRFQIPHVFLASVTRISQGHQCVFILYK